MEKVIALLMVSLVNADHFDAVAPIALYRTRLTGRGFNQAELMAKSDAARINVPVSDKLEVVCRTTDQVELSADTRRSNVAGTYASRGPVAGRILLVDDVFTTGATLSECATVLKKAGGCS